MDAYEGLFEAIAKHAEATDNRPANAVLTDFAVIAAWTPVDPDDGTSYTMHYRSAQIPNHVAQGLVSVAQDITTTTWSHDDGEVD